MQSFTAERDTVAAWIGIGYANGYRRSNRVFSQDSNFVPHVSLLGRHCPVLGYITMQMTAIDITDIYDGKISKQATMLMFWEGRKIPSPLKCSQRGGTLFPTKCSLL